ncbi:dTDP-L-rhamnose 4-epimerase [Desulfatibacillum alkenivorans DSM 16219]|jgi:dTDP-L-rhamnose 4-epimerase|uniref:dTDP-L-rhamnose 4-epimerase n=1 Tax=Desulfatibacillum alkenivorans DSM 16219 TaxID=1121393 RepID=A0A1M6D0M1_9BACT|nr:NAD-dependent epimerase/dehydratase family protein [Desulfatibacillum alkenivorans]SHI66643.1 dTDP-L-rhamnose 4-epimerase [Desulfatibacillum alkenivorans DSM 16219]
MKILVTGGAGFIGSHTVDALVENGHEVRVLDNLQKPVHQIGMPPWLNPGAEFMLGDVRSKDDWKKALQGREAVYHLAAYQDYLPDFSTFFHVNSVGTALMYETAVETGQDLAKIVVASSQFVAGEGLYLCDSCARKSSPVLRPESQLAEGKWEHVCPICGEEMYWQWTPETHVSPPNAYAMAKYSQEIQAMTFGQRYGIPSTAMRYSIVQGPRQSFYNAYSGACRIFSLHYYFDKAPTCYEDGEQCRDFVNIHDVVRANVMALDNPEMEYRVFNVGGGKAYTVSEFAGIVQREFEDRKNKHLADALIPGKYRFGDTRNACSDISALKALGWEPQNTPEQSVKEYVDWLYEQDNVEDILDFANKTMKDLNVVRDVKA